EARLTAGNIATWAAWSRRRPKEDGMKQILFGAGLVAIALLPDFSEAQPASIPACCVTGPGISAVSAAYKKRYPPGYTSHGCANEHEIRELQRMWPETRWPKSMRCFPYR